MYGRMSMKEEARGTRSRGGAVAAVFAAFLSVSVCTGPALAQAPREGGTVVFAHEQEPGTFNMFHPSGQSGAVAAVGGLIHAGTYKFPPTGGPVPFIIAKEAEVGSNPFSVTYTIRDDAKWNDGTPITAEDYAFTYRTIVDQKWTIANRRPYDLVTGFEILGPKVIKFNFSASVPTYKLMFHVLLPKHDLEGKDWDTAWKDTVPVSNGAFKMGPWTKGQQIVFQKNPHFWAGGTKLDRVVLRFVPETNTLLQLLRSGEIDASDPQPQPEIISSVRNMPNIKIDAKTGLLSEFLRFNLKTPGLDKQYVRQAIVMGIDREAIVQQLMKPVDPNATPPQSWVFAPGSPYFKPKYGALAYNPRAAIKLLEDNGCRRGSDQVFVCGGARLDFRYVSTAGNERRQLTFEIVQAFLSQIGIRVRADFSQAAVQFGTRGPKGDYDLFNQGGLFEDPIALGPFMRCDGTLNASGYCNRDLDQLMDRITVTADVPARAALLNEMDAILARDLPLFPVFGLPRMVVYNAAKVGGVNVSPNTDNGVGPGGWYWNWNAHELHLVR